MPAKALQSDTNLGSRPGPLQVVCPQLDPELQRAMPEAGPQSPPIDPTARVAWLREAPAVGRPPDLSRGGEIELETWAVPCPDGQPPVQVLLCRPTRVVDTCAAPAIYFIHGGGMVRGAMEDTPDEVLDWALEFGAVVASVGYRLAPENPDPAPVEDCYAGLVWLAEHADRLGIDESRILIYGASAGGGLAAGVTLMARDRNGPTLAGQVLVCPMLDDRMITASSHMLSNGEGTWDSVSNTVGWTALLGGMRGGPGVSIYAAPARAEDLTGLPPAYLDVGSAEIFRDEVIGYASGIWRVGGDAELHVWPGGFHGFHVIAPGAALSRLAREARGAWVRRLFNR